MKSLTLEEKRYLIESAKEIYRQALIERQMCGDPFALDININNYLHESCYNISNLINYMAQKEYGIIGEDNIIYNGEFKSNGYTYSHTINFICGEYIDGSIEQFNDRIKGDIAFSPYLDNSKCYHRMEIQDINTQMIKEEIEIYEAQLKRRKIQNYNQECKSQKENCFWRKLFSNFIKK